MTRGVTVAELSMVDEAFVTSSTREMVPVTRIAGIALRGGRPGPVFGRLRAAYRRYAVEQARPAWPTWASRRLASGPSGSARFVVPILGERRYARSSMRLDLKRVLACVVVSASLACGASADGPQEPSGALPTSEEAGSDRSETARQRRVRIATAKREACQSIAQAIAEAQQQDMIININNSKAMVGMARQLETNADSIDGVTIEDDDIARLRGLRDEYTGNTRAMATELSKTAGVSGADRQKAAIERFRELEPQQAEIIERINDYCNAPID